MGWFPGLLTNQVMIIKLSISYSGVSVWYKVYAHSLFKNVYMNGYTHCACIYMYIHIVYCISTQYSADTHVYFHTVLSYSS